MDLQNKICQRVAPSNDLTISPPKLRVQAPKNTKNGPGIFLKKIILFGAKYFLFPFFEHFFTDTWIWMLAKSVDRAIYIPEILVEHRHWKIGKSEKDETYERNATKENDSRHARDRALINKFERYFLADVDLLKSNILQG